ncbi:hypothetical protein [uncultured Psychrobacter sp.]|uniref:hypothetical protein n=1 Tax=uncultured Psychrobacter sp. TaxID=259303 RepID=UPI0026276F1C|nr:hypothetical protein [uncultured Psychrobacter sp.]
MRDYKLLLVGIILLLLLIIVGVISWLWLKNSKNIDPLPILSREDVKSLQGESEEDSDAVKNDAAANTLYIQAQQPLQVPLDDVIVSFEARYPHMQVLTNYVPATDLLILDNTHPTDLVIADDKLSDSLLALLEDELNSNVKNNIVNAPSSTKNSLVTDVKNPESQTTTENKEARTLNPFGYAMRESQTVEGVILSDKPLAINFRNFLISSTGQDILRQHEFDNIDGYQNSVDDLFNPTSNGKTAVEDTEIVTDAVTNS